MKVRRSRSVLVLVTGALVLSACGSSAPPPSELGEEMIDSLVATEGVSQDVVDCMQDELATFELTQEELDLGFSDIDEVMAVATDNDAGGRQRALEIVQRLEDQLATCNVAG